MTDIATFNFRGDGIPVVRRDDDVLVPLRAMTDALGLDFQAQQRMIQRSAWSDGYVAITAMQLPGDTQVRQHFTVSHRIIPMWIANISASRIKDDAARAKVIDWQREFASALYEYVLAGGVPTPRAAEVVPQLDELEVARRYVVAIEAKRAAEARAVEVEQKLAIAAPKAAYVDIFVDRNDATTIGVLAGQLGVGPQALRAYLVARGVLYRRTLGYRWSRSRQKRVPEYQWLARSRYSSWFVARDQPEAPRGHNGQMQTTLYCTPAGKAGIAAMLARRPIIGQDDLDAGEST